ncbi:putative 3-demethylubiquinone-9 3-methyltransferase (glyoxalase superfamily) [Clavibacter sp. B3I6]|uniref:VOC family protein n=1 Tax=Clavibacter sp. B3I6 TaxID=3042268 RepID=UPI002780B716|nr:VOC family protein [Clavibacter sp. B3I6]MDQ0743124.1 putative 3-demethylubiquinone-9 3-methyltransferase (glyoxalase superfamily) [Clavibacter sp. B3I6]
MQAITPFLWLDGRVRDAAALYAAVLPRSRVVESSDADGPGSSATVELDGLRVILFDGGPLYPQTPAFSLSVPVETQEELDRIWDALVDDGGAPGRCGWLTDPFGVSWQVVPSILPALLGDPDRERAARAQEAMLGMGRLDIAGLRRAADGA